MINCRLLIAGLVLLAAGCGSGVGTDTRRYELTGQVLAPDGSPVTSGTVGLLTSSIIGRVGVSATIDRTGHFRIVPDVQGSQPRFIQGELRFDESTAAGMRTSAA